MKSQSHAVLGVAALGLLFSAALFAGPLTPPAGPVASTGKTLTEVEPRTALSLANTPGDVDSVYRISSPGSYYLTANMSVPAGKSAIEIAASNVTLDLSGFDITSAASLDAIRVTLDSRVNITVRNGTISGVSGAGGVDIRPFGVTTVTVGGLIENVRVSNTAGIGIRTGNGVVIRNCSVTGAGQAGFNVGDDCMLEDCAASGTTSGSGSVAGSGLSFTNCTSSGNSGSGFSAGSDVSFTGCTASANQQNGISGGFGSSFTNCVAHENTADGIRGTGYSTFTGCIAYGNDGSGIRGSITGVNVVSECCASSNGAIGISAGIDSTVVDCTSNSNGEFGISVYGGSTVMDCSVTGNDDDGIQCRDNCTIRGNTCNQNGNSSSISGAGIRVLLGNNRIEGNNCTNAEFGLYVASAGNVIVRNTCAGNITSYVIAPDNIYGVIVDRRIPTTVGSTPAVTGHAAAGTLGTTDPNANFTY